MSVIRWNPARDLATWSVSDLLPEINQIQREMNRLFDNFLRGGMVDDGSYGTFWSPSVDIIEHDDAYLVEAELPGLTKDDVKISIEGNILTIRGEKKREQTKEDRNYHRTERSYGTFMRSFTLPTSVRADKIEANYRNGILTINLPKVEEAKPKTIEVKIH